MNCAFFSLTKVETLNIISVRSLICFHFSKKFHFFVNGTIQSHEFKSVNDVLSGCYVRFYSKGKTNGMLLKKSETAKNYT